MAQFKRVISMLAAALGLALAVQAHAADTFPTKALKIIVPAAPGGTTDVASRAIAEPMGKEFGQTVVVENKAGGSGIIGTQALLASPADGHTMIMGNIGPNAINYSLYKSLPYKMEDFEPITIVIANPNVLVVNPAVPAKTVAELVALAKAAPGKYSFASSGRGQSIHMSGELLKLAAGIDIIHVPYKGAAPALGDVMAGQVTMMIDNLPSSLPLIRAGRLRPLAVTSKARITELPDVPTMQEAGFRDFEVTAWFGLFVPAGTPKPVIDRIYAVTKKVLDSPDIKARWADLGGYAMGDTPANTRAFVAAERKKWEQVVTNAKLPRE
jgi:tripartite-type tricarboxylate transporter receptor subunit TctC